ncbi:MAG: hypothetical protein P4M14_04595 [Gammaproteobacteria bacterium]|nr:hypothetical protein [Gammaproteobacteria bacterium]
MGLRAILRSIGSSIANNAKKVAKVIAATSLVTFKTGAGGGQAIFGCKKQVAYVRDTLGIPVHPKIEAVYIGTVVGFTVVTSLLTRAGNTFRQILGKDYLVKLGVLRKRAPDGVEHLQIVIEAVPNPALMAGDEPTNPNILVLDDDEDEEKVLAEEAAADALEETDAEEEAEDSEVVEIDPALLPSRARLATQITIDSFISACSLTSTYFTTINSYNFGKQLMGYIEDIDPNTTETSDDVTTAMFVWLQIGAIAITLGNLFSNYYYNSAKARAYGFRFANWATSLKYDVDTNTLTKTEYNHLSDMWSYRYAIGFTCINFGFSEPSNAFFTTMNSITAVPYVTRIFSENSVEIISGCSTGTAVVQNIFTNVPSVKNLLQPEPEVQAALDRLPQGSKRLLRFGQFCGAEDSLITGFSYFIAILYTLNKIDKNISLTDPVAMTIAAICGGIKALTNQGFSVNPALIDLLEDINPEIFEEERNKAKVAKALAENAARVPVPANAEEKEEDNRNQHEVIEMHSSRSKKKKVTIGNSDLHEHLMPPGAAAAHRDSDSDADSDSEYQPPSFASGSRTLASTKSLPNLYQEDKHSPQVSRQSIGKSSTRSPHIIKPLSRAEHVHATDFYAGLDELPHQMASPVLTHPVGPGTFAHDVEEHKHSVPRSSARANASSSHAFMSGMRANNASSSASKHQARTLPASFLRDLPPNIEAGIQSEPIQPRRSAALHRATPQAVRIVHSSQKSGFFSHKKRPAPRKVAADDNLEKKYGRSFGDNY